jgi:hypothetical protein
MALLGLVLRALGVVLLTATVLLPVADHHAASRLPESFARPESVHDLIAHHHARAGAPAPGEVAAHAWELAGGPAVPAVLPGSSFWADGLVVPTAAREGGAAVAAPAAVGWLGAADAVLPPSLDRAPPAPPPIAAA